jgi:hypothetical protein
VGLDGPYIEADAKWRPRHVTDYSVVEHDLQVNAWVFAYRTLVGDHLIDWLGPDQGRIDVPTTYEPHKRRFRRVELEDATLAGDGHHHPRALRLDQFGPLFPDATLTLYCDSIGAEVALLVELDRTRRATKNVDKLRRYDAFLTAWCRMTDRYRSAKEFPYVILVCPGEQEARSLMRVADREVTGQYAGYGPGNWPYPGRKRMLFVAEEDVHGGLALAWSLPRHDDGERETDDFWAVDAELPVGR